VLKLGARPDAEGIFTWASTGLASFKAPKGVDLSALDLVGIAFPRSAIR